MNQVNVHGESLAVDALLARMMKMELDELIGVVANPKRAAGIDIDLDAVTIVDDVQRARAIIEVERREPLVLGVTRSDIDRRLCLPVAASRKLRVEIGPMGRPPLARIRPMVRNVVAERCRTSDDPDRSDNREQVPHVARMVVIHEPRHRDESRSPARPVNSIAMPVSSHFGPKTGLDPQQMSADKFLGNSRGFPTGIKAI